MVEFVHPGKAIMLYKKACEVGEVSTLIKVKDSNSIALLVSEKILLPFILEGDGSSMLAGMPSFQFSS